MQRMSNQGSNHEEAKCNEKAPIKAQPNEIPSMWMKDRIILGNSAKPRWSVSVGKKEDSDGRTKESLLPRAADSRGRSMS